jgi:hypothetical protein
MLSSVLNSERVIEVNILIMQAFQKLREILASHKDLGQTPFKWKILLNYLFTIDINNVIFLI